MSTVDVHKILGYSFVTTTPDFIYS